MPDPDRPFTLDGASLASQSDATIDPSKPHLVRAIGRWSLVALVINNIIGSGIFGLPSSIAKLLGDMAPWAYLLGALVIGVIMAVFAEVGSQFRETGGQYL